MSRNKRGDMKRAVVLLNAVLAIDANDPHALPGETLRHVKAARTTLKKHLSAKAQRSHPMTRLSPQLQRDIEHADWLRRRCTHRADAAWNFFGPTLMIAAVLILGGCQGDLPELQKARDTKEAQIAEQAVVVGRAEESVAAAKERGVNAEVLASLEEIETRAMARLAKLMTERDQIDAQIGGEMDRVTAERTFVSQAADAAKTHPASAPFVAPFGDLIDLLLGGLFLAAGGTAVQREFKRRQAKGDTASIAKAVNVAAATNGTPGVVNLNDPATRKLLSKLMTDGAKASVKESGMTVEPAAKPAA